MPEGDDLPEFEADQPASNAPSPQAQHEEKVFGKQPPKPNTVLIKLWGGGHVSFNPESSVPIFAVMALVLLLISVPIVVLVGLAGGDTTWMNSIMTAIGHAITAVIGAIVGSAIKGKEKD